MVVEWLEANVICWRCGKQFFPSPSGNCLYCGYSLDQEHELGIKVKQLIHDLSGDNTSVYHCAGYYRPDFHRPNRRKKVNGRKEKRIPG